MSALSNKIDRFGVAKGRSDATALTIFSYIGALVPDAADRYIGAFQSASLECGLAPPRRDRLLALIGKKMLGGIIDDVYPEIDAERKAALFEACNRARDGLLAREKLQPGVRSVLRELTDHGHVLGLFTATKEAIDPVLQHHGIEQVFPAYYRGSSTPRGAGDPLAVKSLQLRTLRDRFARTYGRHKPVVVITASVSGCEAARAAGLEVYAYAACPASYARLRQADADVVIFTDYADLPSLLSEKLHQHADDAALPLAA